MIGLVDYDSLIYKSMYRIVSIQEIKQLLAKGKPREWVEKEILDKALGRLGNMGDRIILDIENAGIEISHCEYFITPRKSIRMQLFPYYKQNRGKYFNPMVKWVNKLRSYLLESSFAIIKDGYEADDLIYDRAKTLGELGCIIISMDKDLLQCPGLHYNYYRKPTKEVDEYGRRLTHPPVGLMVVTKEESDYNFWNQMLIGDNTDNIKGVHGIGSVKARKILLETSENHEEAVKLEYQRVYGDEWLKEYEKNHFLLTLGSTDRNYQTINI